MYFVLQKHEIERLSAWHNPTASVDYNLPGTYVYIHLCIHTPRYTYHTNKQYTVHAHVHKNHPSMCL